MSAQRLAHCHNRCQRNGWLTATIDVSATAGSLARASLVRLLAVGAAGCSAAMSPFTATSTSRSATTRISASRYVIADCDVWGNMTPGDAPRSSCFRPQTSFSFPPPSPRARNRPQLGTRTLWSADLLAAMQLANSLVCTIACPVDWGRTAARLRGASP